MIRSATISAIPLGLFAAYVGIFAFWWLSSPSQLLTRPDGRQVRVVEFQFNRASWYTQVAWIPAFWFMEHIVGYREAGFAAMGHESVQHYAK